MRNGESGFTKRGLEYAPGCNDQPDSLLLAMVFTKNDDFRLCHTFFQVLQLPIIHSELTVNSTFNVDPTTTNLKTHAPF